MIRREDSLEYHRADRPGKLEVRPSTPCLTPREMRLAYLPGASLMPPAALLFGLVAAPLFDGPALRERFRGWWGPPVAAVLVVTLGVLSFHYSGVVRQLYRPNALDMGPIVVGHALRDAVPAGELLVTVEYQQYGINSPILLYHAQRRGWSFDMRSISPHVIERLRSRFGARFFVTTLWPQLEQQQPEVAEYLRQKPRVDLGAVPRGTALFQLAGGAGSGGQPDGD